MNIILTFIFLLCLLFVISKFYTLISGHTPTNLLKVDDVNEATNKLTSGLFFLLPLNSLLRAIYNFAYTAVWFLLICLGWYLAMLKWVWVEIVMAAGWRLLKTLYNYTIYLPWRIFKASVETIFDVLDFNVFLISTTGIFSSALITILGKSLVAEFKLPGYIFHIFLTISILPIGLAIASILVRKSPQGFNKVNGISRYFKQAVSLILLFCVVSLLGAGLVYVGSHTTYRYMLSSIMVGGSLFSSGFIIFNSFLLLFVLSALPSYSLTSGNTSKGFLNSYFSYLLNRWYHFLLSVPAAALPIIIVCILPIALTKGVAYVSQEATQEIYKNRIAETQKSLESKKFTADYKKWADVKAISEDSLKKLMKSDFDQLELQEELRMLKINSETLKTNYEKYSSPNGALTLGALGLAYKQYEKVNKHITNGATFKLQESSQSYDSERKFINEDSTRLEEKSKEVKDSLLKLNDQLSKVCDTSKLYSNEQANSDNAAEPINDMQTEIDNCELQRVAIRKLIDEVKEQETELAFQLTRNKAVGSHLASISEKWTSLQTQQKASAKIGDILLMLWLALLWSIAISLGLALYAIVCGKVHLIGEENTKWFFLTQIEEAKSINPNQPLLGFTLLALPFILVALNLSVVTKLFKSLKEVSTNEISNKKIETNSPAELTSQPKNDEKKVGELIQFDLNDLMKNAEENHKVLEGIYKLNVDGSSSFAQIKLNSDGNLTLQEGSTDGESLDPEAVIKEFKLIENKLFVKGESSYSPGEMIDLGAFTFNPQTQKYELVIRDATYTRD